MNDNRVFQVGEAVIRPDALSKVTGDETYAIDGFGTDFLWAGVKRAGIPHARIIHISKAAALGMPGVRAVLTAGDIKGKNRQGVIRKDQPVLADDRVRHCGDAVALVVAESPATLSAALDAIVPEFDPLEAVFDPEEALRPGAPVLHPEHPGANALFTAEVRTGSVETAFDGCPAVVEACFELPRQAHAFLETENGWAVTDEHGRIEITVSTQTPFRDRMETAEALGISPDRIRIIAPHCGGAFGGKDGITVQSLLALAALTCPGVPVKMWWRREESFLAGAKRHPARLYYRLGAKTDGTLSALSARLYFDTGPYDHLGGVVAALGLEHAGGSYRIPSTHLAAWAVYTNNPLSGAFRGFGVPQAAGAMESMMDMMAEKLRICPLALRRKNALVRGDRCPAGVTRQGSVGLLECLKTLEAHPLWKERDHWKVSAGPFKMRGTGIACMSHGMGYGPTVPDSATAGIRLMDDGRFEVMAGVVDMGQGNVAAYLQIAGDILSQPPEHLIAILPDTDKTFPCGSSSASRTTFTYANALIGAATALKERIFARAADALMVSNISALVLVPGAVRHLSTGQEMPLSRLGMFLNPAERVATYHYRAPVSGEPPHPDANLRLHGFPHLIFSHAAHLVRVEVDMLTGQVSVPEYLAVSDCGRILNPRNFSGQQEGAVVQGLGYALSEEVIADKGRMVNRDFTTYIIPTTLDAPNIESVAVPLADEAGPFGLKGAGEIGIDIPLPAVANALFDACGVRFLKFPMTPERILAALMKKDVP